MTRDGRVKKPELVTQPLLSYRKKAFEEQNIQTIRWLLLLQSHTHTHDSHQEVIALFQHQPGG